MRGGLHLADFRVAVFGELLGGLAGVLGGLGYHGGFDVVESAEFIVDIAVGDGHTLTEQIHLLVEQLA